MRRGNKQGLGLARVARELDEQEQNMKIAVKYLRNLGKGVKLLYTAGEAQNVEALEDYSSSQINKWSLSP